MRRLFALVVVLGMVATACGDSDGGGRSSGEQAVIDAITREILAEADPDTPFGETEARCLAEGVVDEMGLDRLAALGITAEQAESPDEALADAPQEDIDTFVDVTLECVDFRSLLTQQFSEGISTESAECLADGISDDFIRAAAIAGITGEEFAMEDNPEMATEIFTLVAECLTPEELSNLGDG